MAMEISAVRNWFTAVPHNNRDVVLACLPTFAMLYTKKMETSAPAKASRDVEFMPIKFVEKLARMPIVAPKAAPEEIPKIKGSAIGFLKIA